MTGVRAQAYDYGAPELVALELYLMSRARGLHDGDACRASLVPRWDQAGVARPLGYPSQEK